MPNLSLRTKKELLQMRKKLEAAGIEPASHSPRNEGVSSDFFASTEIAGIEFRVQRDGKHLNMHLFDEDHPWRFVEVDDVLIRKFEFLLEVLKISQEAHDTSRL